MSLSYKFSVLARQTAKVGPRYYKPVSTLLSRTLATTTDHTPYPPSPPFPGGKKVDIAPLQTIDFAKLVNKDETETSRLLNASQSHGFFYLDLQTTEPSRQLLEDEKNVLKVMEKYFDQPGEIKMKDDRHDELHGYKPLGKFTGVVKDTRDCYETLKVAREEMVAKSSKLPATVKDNIHLFDSFISLSQHVTQTMLARLSDALHLSSPKRLEKAHREGEPTNTTLVLLHYPEDADEHMSGHNKHTDIGSLTLLFSNQWGLQTVTPETKSWTYIQPRPGHAIINIGDSLRFLSAKQLMSCLHRVVPVPGQGNRYSIAYFLRPESAVKFVDAEGKKVTAEEWHDDKYVMFAEPHKKQEQSEMLTGGMENVLSSTR